MKVIKRYNQHRRDLWIDLECQGCQATKTYKRAYDDSNFWANVVPAMKCDSCGESTNSLGEAAQPIEPRYPEGLQL